MSQVLKAILAAILRASQNDDVVLTSWDIQLDIFILAKVDLGVDYLEALQLRAERFGKGVLTIVLGVDVAVPAVECLNIRHSDYVSAVVLVVLQVSLAGLHGRDL